MRYAALLVAVGTLGCGSLHAPWQPMWPQPAPARLVARADAVATHDPRGARELYLRVLRDYPDDPAAAQALYGVGRLAVDPDSPLLDYRTARATFKRLLARYPESPWAADARAWYAVLSAMSRQETEATRLRGDLRDLKEQDMELERRR